MPVLILAQIQIQTSQSSQMGLQGLHFNIIKSKDSDQTQCGQRDSSLPFFSVGDVVVISAVSQSSGSLAFLYMVKLVFSTIRLWLGAVM